MAIMPEWLRDRLTLWRGAIHWGWVVILGIWEVLSAAFHFRDNFLSQDLRAQLETQAFVSHWDWHVWVIGTLLIIAVASLEGCYSQHEKILGGKAEEHRNAIEKLQALNEDLENRHAGVVRDLTAERERNSRPEIKVTIERASFERGPTIYNATGPEVIESRDLFIIVVFYCVNVRPQPCTVSSNRCALFLNTSEGQLSVWQLGDRTLPNDFPKKLRTPNDAPAMEKDLRLMPGMGETRSLIFQANQRKKTDGEFDAEALFRFAIVDSFEQQWQCEKRARNLCGDGGHIAFS